jgi:hypothetical protein
MRYCFYIKAGNAGSRPSSVLNVYDVTTLCTERAGTQLRNLT